MPASAGPDRLDPLERAGTTGVTCAVLFAFDNATSWEIGIVGLTPEYAPSAAEFLPDDVCQLRFSSNSPLAIKSSKPDYVERRHPEDCTGQPAWITDKTLPAGSLNHAISGPPP